MLNVILKNHDFKYEVAELIKLFTSEFQFVDNKSFGMVLENTLLEYIEIKSAATEAPIKTTHACIAKISNRTP